ncbi:MAG: hypothetical protein V1729_03125 [Candidatus Woesearchaeota archaeon]
MRDDLEILLNHEFLDPSIIKWKEDREKRRKEQYEREQPRLPVPGSEPYERIPIYEPEEDKKKIPGHRVWEYQLGPAHD